MTESFCVLCAVFHPEADRHAPDRSQTCEAGRRRLERDRLAVRAMYLRLEEQESALLDSRRRSDTRPRDPIAHALPMALTPGRSHKPVVSGSRERQLPINVDVVDLTSRAQLGTVEDSYGDQAGLLSVATVLFEWVRSWHAAHFPAETLPPPSAVRLLDWLAGVRLEILCENDPAIADFAIELTEMRKALRTALGENSPQLAVMWGVPCRRCDSVSTLRLDPDDPDRYRECSNPRCGLLMSELEYKAWLIAIVEELRAAR